MKQDVSIKIETSQLNKEQSEALALAVTNVIYSFNDEAVVNPREFKITVEVKNI